MEEVSQAVLIRDTARTALAAEASEAGRLIHDRSPPMLDAQPQALARREDDGEGVESPSPPPIELVTAAEIAERLGLRHAHLVREWSRNVAHFPKPVGRRTHFLWSWSAVEDWVRLHPIGAIKAGRLLGFDGVPRIAGEPPRGGTMPADISTP
jgi:hypothetical protein